MREMLRGVWRQTTTDADGCPKRFYFFNWAALFLVFASTLLIAICEATGGRFYVPYRGWYFLAPFAFFVLAFLGPVLRTARDDRYRGVRVVVSWGLVGLVFFVITFVAAFSSFVPPNDESYDRLLNILPAVIAIWVAGLGWYTHHQITMKGHRTTHAFNLIMQTRTSAEFLRNMRTFQLIYPPGIPMVRGDKELFTANAIAQIPSLEKTRDDATKTTAERSAAVTKIAKIEAAISAKYLLNYYEFIARGIHGGDIDAEVLYDTIAPTMIGIVDRTAALHDMYKDTQPLAGQFLRPLVKKWSTQKRRDAGNAPR